MFEGLYIIITIINCTLPKNLQNCKNLKILNKLCSHSFSLLANFLFTQIYKSSKKQFKLNNQHIIIIDQFSVLNKL